MASGTASTAKGFEAVASLYGQHAQASGKFAAVGDAQTSVLTLRGTSTTNDIWAYVYLNGSSSQISVADETAKAVTVTLTGRQDTGATHYMARRMLIVERTGGTCALSGEVQTIGTDIGADFTVNISANNTAKSMDIIVKTTTGGDINVRWVARVEMVEVGYAD